MAKENSYASINPENTTYYPHNRLPHPVIGGDPRRRRRSVMGPTPGIVSDPLLLTLQPPGLPASSNGTLGTRRMSFADSLQADNGHSVIYQPIAHPLHRNISHSVYSGARCPEQMYTGTSSQRLAGVQSLGSSISQPSASDHGAAFGRSMEINSTSGFSAYRSDCSHMTTALGGHFGGSMNPSLVGMYNGSSCPEHLRAQNNLHSSVFFDKNHRSNNLFRDSQTSLNMPYPSNPFPSSAFSNNGTTGRRQNDRLSRSPSIARGAAEGSTRPRNSENGFKGEVSARPVLEEFKNNKSRQFELSDIVNNVSVFSVDQLGSRFMLQKLETASVEEKNRIFPEVLQNARPLMIDSFGNYVMQKFFEHGTETQIKQLANQLTGHVLSLSLQMYGSTVIQKALEVVDIDQQTQIVAELDGAVMNCVNDQNGNHVIQKCIECVPQERIQFIISSFYGEVVSLSTHPYGCRVMQRVLEHCHDEETQSKIVDEILGSVCNLVLHQYGNYVVQHVLQHGKPEARSAIIIKLVEQMVKMSRKKHDSNVVEKCLTSGPEECQVLVNKLVDHTEPQQGEKKATTSTSSNEDNDSVITVMRTSPSSTEQENADTSSELDSESLWKSMPLKKRKLSSQHTCLKDDVLKGSNSGNRTEGEIICIPTEPSSVPPPRLPFVKISPLWAKLESDEAFQIVPQNPHFSVLAAELTEHPRLLEGSAVGLTISYKTLVSKLRDLRNVDSSDNFKDQLNALAELEANGFDVKFLKDHIKNFLEMKTKVTQIDKERTERKARFEETRAQHERDVSQELLADKKVLQAKEHLKCMLSELETAKLKRVNGETELDTEQKAVEAIEDAFDSASNKCIAVATAWW